MDSNQFEMGNESSRSARTAVEQERYDQLINENNSLKELLRNKTSFERKTNEEQCLKIPVKEYENLISRVTLIENKLLIVEVIQF